MLRTNADKLIKTVVEGTINHPSPNPYIITAWGEPVVLPGTGGITLNIRIGDLAIGWVADHVEPGVTIKNSDGGANSGLNTLASIGNEAVIADGDAKGEKGVVVGKHGGAEHVMIDLPWETMEKLNIGNKFVVRAHGLGLKLLDHPDVTVMSVDPGLVDKLVTEVDEDGKLVIPVTHHVPAAIMGSGLGSNQAYRGDYDIQLFDEKTVAEYGLKDLRFGDLVALVDADSTYGRIYKTGAITVGIVVHSDCVIAGHGPGVTTLFTSTKGMIVPKLDPNANIAKILGLRDDL